MNKNNCPTHPNTFQKNLEKGSFAKGFTVVELLLVIVLIGILSGVLMNTINIGRQRDYANDGVRRQNLMDTAHALETYFAVERSYPAKGDAAQGYSPLTGTDSTIASQYIGLWPDGFIYNEDGSDFSIHVLMGSSTNYFKFSSTWKKIKECTPNGIGVVDTCTAP